MLFTSYSKDDNSYTFNGQNGEKVLIPATEVISIDDLSGAISIKMTGGRNTIGYLIK